MNPFEPYSTLESLLAAAGVSVAEMDRYTVAEMVALADQRAAPPVAPGRDVRAPYTGAPWSTRTIRLPLGLEIAIDERAEGEKTNFNAVANRLLLAWVTGK